MKYSVTSKKNWCATKVFDNLQDAIEWADKRKTKLGHRVSHLEIVTMPTGATIARTRTDYETFGNK